MIFIAKYWNIHSFTKYYTHLAIISSTKYSGPLSYIFWTFDWILFETHNSVNKFSCSTHYVSIRQDLLTSATTKKEHQLQLMSLYLPANFHEYCAKVSFFFDNCLDQRLDRPALLCLVKLHVNKLLSVNSRPDPIIWQYDYKKVYAIQILYSFWSTIQYYSKVFGDSNPFIFSNKIIQIFPMTYFFFQFHVQAWSFIFSI